jgi:hypothetical protein
MIYIFIADIHLRNKSTRSVFLMVGIIPWLTEVDVPNVEQKLVVTSSRRHYAHRVLDVSKRLALILI